MTVVVLVPTAEHRKHPSVLSTLTIAQYPFVVPMCEQLSWGRKMIGSQVIHLDTFWYALAQC